MDPQNPYQPPQASLETYPRGGQPVGTWEIGSALSAGWALFKDHLAAVLVTLLIMTGVSMVFSMITNVLSQVATSSDSRATALALTMTSLVINLVSMVVSTFLQLGFLKICIDAVKSSPQVGLVASPMAPRPQIADLFSCGRCLLVAIAASLLSALLILVGFVLLIVPGVILALGLQFTLYLVVDRNMGPIEAMKESWRITTGHKASLFLYGLVCAALVIAGLLACFIGVFVATPVISLASAFIYISLVGPGEAAVESATPGGYGAPGTLGGQGGFGGAGGY